MTPIDRAAMRAAAGLSWEYPCIFWACDFVEDCGFANPADRWPREMADKVTCAKELRRIHELVGEPTPVASVIKFLADECDWIEQGAHGPFVGVYNIEGVGYPALKQQGDFWLFAGFGDAHFTKKEPCKYWSLR